MGGWEFDFEYLAQSDRNGPFSLTMTGGRGFIGHIEKIRGYCCKIDSSSH